MLKKLFSNKKARFFDFQERWVEIASIFLLIIGFIVALWARSAVVIYMVILLSGIIAGRGLMARKYTHRLAYIIIIIGYLVGFFIGWLTGFYGRPKYILVLFIIGGYIGYVLHSREWI